MHTYHIGRSAEKCKLLINLSSYSLVFLFDLGILHKWHFSSSVNAISSAPCRRFQSITHYHLLQVWHVNPITVKSVFSALLGYFNRIRFSVLMYFMSRWVFVSEKSVQRFELFKIWHAIFQSIYVPCFRRIHINLVFLSVKNMKVNLRWYWTPCSIFKDDQILKDDYNHGF